jgi:hypothetical protein
LAVPQKPLPFRWASIKGKIEIAVGLSKPSVIDSLEQGILMMILLSQKLLTKEVDDGLL